MKANPNFTNLPLEFWANIKYLSNQKGYSDSLPRGLKLKDNITVPPEIKKIKEFLAKKKTAIPQVKAFTSQEIIDFFKSESFNTDFVMKKDGKPTKMCLKMESYLQYRADVLNNQVEGNLMDFSIAEQEFNRLKEAVKPTIPFPMNKQKGNKKVIAYFTSIINMLIEQGLRGTDFDHDPRKLAMFTENNYPSRILSRTVDGAYPSIIDPIALWEIKEYYFTTSFGSRVADGVYESLLDGMELKEVESNLGKKVGHYLFVDAYYTWWIQGKSYLCRMMDMLHMGIITEIIIGKEVTSRLPILVKEWVKKRKLKQLNFPLGMAAEPKKKYRK